MLCKRVLRPGKRRGLVYEYLIKCDYCGKEEWLEGKKCEHGKRKFCSHSCGRKGKKHTDEWKKDLSIKNSGEGNPFYGKKHSEKNTILCRENGAKSLSVFMEKLSEEEYNAWLNNKSENSKGSKNPFYGKKHTEETKLKMSETKATLLSNGNLNLNAFKNLIKGWYFSHKSNEKFYYDSFYEFIKMKSLDLDNSVIIWTKKHGIKIPYILNNKIKHYVPDFLIKKEDCTILEEVKGYEKSDIKEAKLFALKKFCEENNYTMMVSSVKEISAICINTFGQSLYSLRKLFIKGEF